MSIFFTSEKPPISPDRCLLLAHLFEQVTPRVVEGQVVDVRIDSCKKETLKSHGFTFRAWLVRYRKVNKK